MHELTIALTRCYVWKDVICGHRINIQSYIYGCQKIVKSLNLNKREVNPEDLYTVSMIKDDTIVGHVSHKKSHVVRYILLNTRSATCQVITQRKHGENLEIMVIKCSYCIYY